MNLFILPRIHQNVVSELEELQNSNQKFEIICLNKSINDKKYKTYIIKSLPILSFISSLILGELPNNGFIIPSLSSVKYIFNSIRSSKTIFLREVRFPVIILSLLIIIIFKKHLVLRIQHSSKKLPLTYYVILLIFEFFNLNIKIHNALPFSSSKIIFKPFKKPFFKKMPAVINQDFTNINITTIGKLEKRKRLLFSIKVAEELLMKNVFESINVFLCVTYKDKDSQIIIEELKSYSKNLINNFPQLKIHFYISINNIEVLDLLSRSHIYLHPADNEPASYSIVEAFASGAYVISQEDCFTSDYLPDIKFRKKIKDFTPENVSKFIENNFEIISSQENRFLRSNTPFEKQ